MYKRQTCYMCQGERFLEMENNRHLLCPTCEGNGFILVKDGDPPPIPGRLVRTIWHLLGFQVN